jgi:hypothetical protein
MEAAEMDNAIKAARRIICRLTPQFSGRALKCDARRERIMKWRARAVAAPSCHGPLQLLVSRWHYAALL